MNMLAFQDVDFDQGVVAEPTVEPPRFVTHEDFTIAPLNFIFVFGSNLAGFHGAGAALAAYKYYGATLGQGEGLSGISYAIPTKDENLRPRELEDIRQSVNTFVQFTHDHPEMNFFVTRVGCGLAGFKDRVIAPMFKGAINCSFAEEWRAYL